MGEDTKQKEVAKGNKQTTKQADGANSDDCVVPLQCLIAFLVTATLRAHFNW
jgi:hypothetical protein